MYKIIIFDFRNIEEFRKGNVEKEIVDIRYKHHLNRVRETLNQIIIERNKIQSKNALL